MRHVLTVPRAGVILMVLAMVLIAVPGVGENERTVIDLTHPLSPEIPTFAGPGGETFKLIPFVSYDKGYYMNLLCSPEHIGTHVDAPSHFAQGAPHVADLDPRALIGPGVVVDVRDAAKSNPDYQVAIADLLKWERRHGKIPTGSLVLFRTGWGERWGSPARYRNADSGGVMHFPGCSKEAAAWLLSERKIRALGIDTLSLDYGSSTDFPVHGTMLSAGKYFIENLANLEQLPPTGALIVVAPLKIKNGSGSPARVFALLP